ncbi:hypothetical protein C1645_830748 [Glomus cerebriforme]|uniref:Helicase ATP-binding domain-containing protein n=1 Tax=Glomus cerebriforme TaxID=658196 RepID=A0A397SRK6_9GLOM|nr:hypothetical protein C1645_830748 [Glomus cerebriforme]
MEFLYLFTKSFLYNLIVQKNPSNYKSYQRANKSWFVVNTSFEFEVLPLHKELSEFLLPKNYYYNLEKTLQQNVNVGYVHLQNKVLNESSWVPLLPGYTVYTSLGLGLNEPNIIEILHRAVHKSSVICRIKLEEGRKSIIPKSAQAVHEENKSSLYNANHNIKWLKTKITQLQNEKSNSSSETNLKQKYEEIKVSVNNILNEKKLGSAIFISMEQYLSLVLSNPCSYCYNTNIQNKSYHTSCIGFKIKIDVDCLLYKTIDSYSNQSKDINFLQLVAVATLAGGINHYAMQTALAVIANESAKQACAKEKKFLSVGYDCSWSYSRNAGQANGSYGHKAIIAFHVVEKSWVAVKKGKDESEKKKQIIPVLEVSDLLLEVCIDRDLDSNKTLANVSVVMEIYADLKHQYARYYSFEQHIMRYFYGCVFAAGLKKKNNELDALTNEELCYIQVEELQGFDFSQELILYKCKAEERIWANIFYLSFVKLIPDFDAIIKCQGCSAFRKKLQILLAAKHIFGYDQLQEGQLEAVEIYLSGKDILLSIKTGGGKTFCYVRELIHLGIPYASIYANTVQGKNEQEKIFEEVSIGFTKVFFITAEKHCLNREFQHFIDNMYSKEKIHFVIDEIWIIYDI